MPKFRSVALTDAPKIWEAVYGGGAEKYYRSSERPSYKEHIAWLHKSLKSKHHKLFLVEIKGVDVSHVRLDIFPQQPNFGEISIYLLPDFRGLGLGGLVLKKSTKLFFNMGFSKIEADICEKNLASLKIFTVAGYSHINTNSNGFRRYRILSSDAQRGNTPGI